MTIASPVRWDLIDTAAKKRLHVEEVSPAEFERIALTLAGYQAHAVKTCTQCWQTKSIALFGTDAVRVSDHNLRLICLACDAKNAKARRARTLISIQKENPQ